MATLRQAAYVAFLASLARGNADAEGSFSIGDKAPFGLPDSSFRSSSQANATGSLRVPTFNTSNPHEPLEFEEKFWSLEISLQADIPLNGSTDKNLSAAEKKQFTQLVSMAFNNVGKNEAADLTRDATMCGHIMFNLRPNVTADNQDDAGKGGNCDFLSQQCQKDFADFVKSGSTNCNSITVPDSCEEWFDSSSSGDESLQKNSALIEFTEELLTGSRFFTMGLEPTSSDNETEYDAAIRNIWPVLLTWSQVTNTVNVTDSALHCIRPNDVTSGSRDPDASNKTSNGTSGNGDHPGAAGTYSVPSLGATLLLAVSASCFMFL